MAPCTAIRIHQSTGEEETTSLGLFFSLFRSLQCSALVCFASQMWFWVGWISFGSAWSRECFWVKCVLAPSVFPWCEHDGAGGRWHTAGLCCLPGGWSLCLPSEGLLPVPFVPLEHGEASRAPGTQSLDPYFTLGWGLTPVTWLWACQVGDYMALFIYLFILVTKMGEYLDGATPPINCCLYFSLLSRVSHIWSIHSPAVVCELCWHVLT